MESAAESAAETLVVPHSPILKVVLIASAIFVIAHLLLLIGLTTPDKITFDEVHYVPAAKQMNKITSTHVQPPAPRTSAATHSMAA